jgi:hypothetical protein
VIRLCLASRRKLAWASKGTLQFTIPQTFDAYLDGLLFSILMENVHTVLNDLDMLKFTYTALDKGHSTAACTGTFFQLFYY